MEIEGEDEEYEIVREGFDYKRKCKHCGVSTKLVIKGTLPGLIKKAGGSEYDLVHNYTEHEFNDEQFSGWDLAICDICGKRKVLVYYWSYYSTGPDVCVVSPSEEIKIPVGKSDNYSDTLDIRVCAFCRKARDKNPKPFINKLIKLLQKTRDRKVKDDD